MRRAYNSNISERANRSLARREAEVRAQKCCIALTIVFVVLVGIMWCTSLQIFEGEDELVVMNKYYKTICVEAGDTLWDIAGEYVSDNTLTVYIKRLREKLEDEPANPTLIKTVRGIGYRMD